MEATERAWRRRQGGVLQRPVRCGQKVYHCLPPPEAETDRRCPCNEGAASRDKVAASDAPNRVHYSTTDASTLSMFCRLIEVHLSKTPLVVETVTKCLNKIKDVRSDVIRNKDLTSINNICTDGTITGRIKRQ